MELIVSLYDLTGKPQEVRLADASVGEGTVRGMRQDPVGTFRQRVYYPLHRVFEIREA